MTDKPTPGNAAGWRRQLLIVGLRLRIAWRSALLWVTEASDGT